MLPSSAQVPAPRVTLLLDQVHQMMNGHRFQSPAKVLALALAVFLAGCGGSHASTSPTGSPSHSTPGSLKPVAMPTVLGYSVPFAKHEIRSMGLKGPTKVIPTPNGSWPQYRITGTIPPAGKLVLADSPVTFYIASGPAVCIACTGRGMVVKMPDVCGKTFQEANTLLVEMGITLDQTPIRRASSEPRGTVIGSVPAAGTHFVAYGSSSAKEVVVTVSSGGGTSVAGGQGGC